MQVKRKLMGKVMWSWETDRSSVEMGDRLKKGKRSSVLLYG